MDRSNAEKAKALAGAKTAVETIIRLNNLQEGVRSLTDKQSDDLTEAYRSYMAATEVLPELPAFSDESIRSGGFLERAGRMIGVLRPMYETKAMLDRDPKMRGLLRSVDDTGSGRASDSPGDDAIRSMLGSPDEPHGFTHDFDLIDGFDSTRDEAIRAIADFSDSGALYTTDFAGKVAMYLRTESPWFNLATVVRADNGRPMNVPTLTTDATTYTPGEGTAITESTPTIGSAAVVLTSYKVLSYLSWESFEDVEYNITDWLARSAARSISLSFDSSATTTVLAGINNGGTATGVGGNGTAASTFFGYEDLIDLKYGRAAPYRASAQWIMANGAIKKTAKFKDEQRQYFWQPASTTGQPSPLLEAPVYEAPNLAAPASATKSVLYGDASAALIIKATNLRVATSTDFRFSNDQIAIKTVLRAGIAVQDPAAMAYLVSANT